MVVLEVCVVYSTAGVNPLTLGIIYIASSPTASQGCAEKEGDSQHRPFTDR